MNQPISTKDLQGLNALILLEYSGNKKGAMHNKCLTNPNLKKLSCTLAEKHKARFEALQKCLDGYK